MPIKKRGFTLIELLVVVAIIALLLSIVMPALRIAKEHAKRTTCSFNLRTIGQATFTYAANHNDSVMPSMVEDYAQPSPPLTYYAYFIHNNPFYTATQIRNLEHVTKGPFNFAFLYQTGIVDNPEIFYCPSAALKPQDPTQIHHYDAYHDETHPWPWNNDYTGSGFNLDKVRTSYNYLPQNSRKKDHLGFPVIARKTTELSASSTLAVDLLMDLDQLAHKKGTGRTAGGVNALYSDGSVWYANDSEAFEERYWDPRPNGNWSNFRMILQLLR